MSWHLRIWLSKAIYCIFMGAMTLGLPDALSHLLHENGILPSLSMALTVGGLGLLGCVGIYLTGALEPGSAEPRKPMEWV